MEDKADWLELRRNMRSRWLSSIQEFADFETQRQNWLDRANTNPHWSFIEYMCCYFDDLGLTDTAQGYQTWITRGLVTQEETEAVEGFHALAAAYNSPRGDDYDNGAVLDDPLWHVVVAAAKTAQQRLAQLIIDPEELLELLVPYTDPPNVR